MSSSIAGQTESRARRWRTMSLRLALVLGLALGRFVASEMSGT